MISAVELDRLRERAAVPASPVLSVYLDVDQSRGTNRKFEAVLKTWLRTIEQRLPQSARETFRADAARVQKFVAHYRPRAKTLVVFADGEKGPFWSGDLKVAMPTE